MVYIMNGSMYTKAYQVILCSHSPFICMFGSIFEGDKIDFRGIKLILAYLDVLKYNLLCLENLFYYNLKLEKLVHV